MKWIIRSTDEFDDETNENLYWNNDEGWVDKQSATVFTQKEYEEFAYSGRTPAGSVWEWERELNFVANAIHKIMVNNLSLDTYAVFLSPLELNYLYAKILHDRQVWAINLVFTFDCVFVDVEEVWTLLQLMQQLGIPVSHEFGKS